MYTLPDGATLHSNLSSQDFEYIMDIIQKEDLSYYLVDSNDFLAIKNGENKIISFGRIYSIGAECKELSSVWVDSDYRGQKIGLYLCEKLIQEKKGSDELFLATKTSLEKYYGALGFQSITSNIPEKLVHTGIWAKEHGIEFVIMKYEK